MNEKRRRANALMMKYYNGLIDEGSWKTAAGNIAVFNTKYRRNLNSLVVQLEPIQSGSGDPSPDNIRPISGWTGATVYHTGKNIYDKNATNPSNGYVADHYLASSGNETTNDSWNISEYIEIDVANIILFVTAGYSPSICFYGENKEYITGTQYRYRNTIQITTPQNARYTRISVPKNGINDVRLAYGTNTNVTWSNSADIVYGGTVDVVSGKLTVDRKKITIDNTAFPSSVWNVANDTEARQIVYINATGILQDASTASNVLRMCNEFVAARYNSAPGYIYIDNKYINFTVAHSTFANDSAVREFLAAKPIEFVYMLAEPITYQLTPQQIHTLIGENVIWSNAGPVDVEYWG